MTSLLNSIKIHSFKWFIAATVVIISILSICSSYERNLWSHTTGRITYVKEIGDHNFIYTIEYMTQAGNQIKKVRLFQNDKLPPFRGQKIQLKYKRNNIQEFAIVSGVKYAPELFETETIQPYRVS